MLTSGFKMDATHGSGCRIRSKPAISKTISENDDVLCRCEFSRRDRRRRPRLKRGPCGVAFRASLQTSLSGDSRRALQPNEKASINRPTNHLPGARLSRETAPTTDFLVSLASNPALLSLYSVQQWWAESCVSLARWLADTRPSSKGDGPLRRFFEHIVKSLSLHAYYDAPAWDTKRDRLTLLYNLTRHQQHRP